MLREYSSIEGDNVDYDAETLKHHFDTLILKTTKYVLGRKKSKFGRIHSYMACFFPIK